MHLPPKSPLKNVVVAMTDRKAFLYPSCLSLGISDPKLSYIYKYIQTLSDISLHTNPSSVQGVPATSSLYTPAVSYVLAPPFRFIISYIRFAIRINGFRVISIVEDNAHYASTDTFLICTTPTPKPRPL